MITSVYAKTLWERRRSTLWWTVGLVLLSVATIAFYPSIRNDAQSFDELVDSMPEGLLAAFNIDDSTSLTTPSGFINSRLYSGIGPVLLAVFGIAVGTAAIAGEEDRGTLNLLMAQPISRTRLVTHKFAAAVTLTVILCAAILATLLVSNPLVDLGFSVANMIAANVGLALLTLVFAAFALAVGGMTGNRALTVGLSAALAVVAFFVNGVAAIVEEVEWTRNLSPFYWLQGPNRLANGFSPGWSGLMVVVIALLVALAIWGFNRRDIGT